MPLRWGGTGGDDRVPHLPALSPGLGNPSHRGFQSLFSLIRLTTGELPPWASSFILYLSLRAPVEIG
jgi:hypothetical protein